MKERQKGFLSPLLVLAADTLWCSDFIQSRTAPSGLFGSRTERRQCICDLGVIACCNATETVALLVPSVDLYVDSPEENMQKSLQEKCWREVAHRSNPFKPVQNQCRKILQPLKISWFLSSISPLSLGQLHPNTMVMSSKISIDIFNTQLIYVFVLFHSVLDYIKITLSSLGTSLITHF